MDQAARPCVDDGVPEVNEKSENSGVRDFEITIKESQNDLFEEYNLEEDCPDYTNETESVKGYEKDKLYNEIADEYSIASDSILEEIILEKEIYLLKQENEMLKNEAIKNKETISNLEKRLTAVEKLAKQIQETKAIVTNLQQNLYDEQTIAKNTKKLTTIKVDKLFTDFEELKFLIEKNSENQNKTHQSLTELRRCVKEELKNINTKITCETTMPQATKAGTEIPPDPQSPRPQEQSSREEVIDDDFTPVTNSSRQRRSNHGNPPRRITDLQCKTFIIGDSILQGIFPKKFDRSGYTRIRTLRGRNIKGIKSHLETINLVNVESIIIHAGTNNLATETESEIVLLFEDIIKYIKDKYPETKLLISTILPREVANDYNDPDFNDKIDSINDNLRIMASRLEYFVIDNSRTLRDPELRRDGLHLTERGTSLLVRNFKYAVFPVREDQKTSSQLHQRNFQQPPTSHRHQYPYQESMRIQPQTNHHQADTNQGEQQQHNFANVQQHEWQQRQQHQQLLQQQQIQQNQLPQQQQQPEQQQHQQQQPPQSFNPNQLQHYSNPNPTSLYASHTFFPAQNQMSKPSYLPMLNQQPVRFLQYKPTQQIHGQALFQQPTSYQYPIHQNYGMNDQYYLSRYNEIPCY